MSYTVGISSVLNDEFLVNGCKLHGEDLCGDIEIKGSCKILKTDNPLMGQIVRSIFKEGSCRKTADYVIISDSVILICELKSNNTTKGGQQMKNTGNFINYLLVTIKDNSKINLRIPPIKYVRFASKYVSKQRAKPEKLSSNDWEGRELFSLACNSTYFLNQFN